jgi:hypothetical protein
LIEPMISSPGIGRQQVASCTAIPRCPRITTLPTSGRGVALASSRWRSSLRATTAGKPLAEPMSASSSCFECAPESRTSRSHAVASNVEKRHPGDLQRLLEQALAEPADSSYCIVFR